LLTKYSITNTFNKKILYISEKYGYLFKNFKNLNFITYWRNLELFKAKINTKVRTKGKLLVDNYVSIIVFVYTKG
jgi:hypothetical protein